MTCHVIGQHSDSVYSIWMHPDCRSRAFAPAPEPPAAEEVPKLHSRKQQPLLLRVVYYIFPAWPMVMIWFLVAANYVIHMVVRETAWSTPVVIAGHAITAVQMVAFFQCVHTHPGSPPPGWGTAAQPTGYWTTCVVEGVPLPPRAFYVRRLGEAILGFDHFCWWLGVPVGWRNRKFFVQFVLWSSVLSGFALVLTLRDLVQVVPGFEFLGGKPMHVDHHKLNALMAASPVGQPLPMMLIGLAMSELSSAELIHAGCLYLLVGCDAVACALLGGFGAYHVYLILHNRTSMEPPGEGVYQLSRGENWRQVMGRKWRLWLLPLWLDDGPIGDGMSWPTNQVEDASAHRAA